MGADQGPRCCTRMMTLTSFPARLAVVQSRLIAESRPSRSPVAHRPCAYFSPSSRPARILSPSSRPSSPRSSPSPISPSSRSSRTPSWSVSSVLWNRPSADGGAPKKCDSLRAACRRRASDVTSAVVGSSAAAAAARSLDGDGVPRSSSSLASWIDETISASVSGSVRSRWSSCEMEASKSEKDDWDELRRLPWLYRPGERSVGGSAEATASELSVASADRW